MSHVTTFSVSRRIKRTPEEKKKSEALRKEAQERDSEMVVGVFKNLEAPGGSLTFTYRAYKEDDYQIYELKDGQEYTIPYGVAKHINNHTRNAKREYATNEKGEKQLYTIVTGARQRYQFLSKEFM